MAAESGRDTLRGKLTLRLMAPLTLLIVLNSLDRVNVSFAAARMKHDLGFSPAAYGLGVSVFFIGYIALQFPHAMSLRRVNPRTWIFATVFLWGLVASAMAFIHSLTAFYALRFLLGAVEGGFAPGILYYLSQWAPRRYRGWTTAGSMLAIPISVVIGAPLSGWLMTMAANPAGLSAWRWMFLVEGLIPMVLAFGALAVFKNRMEDAPWLTSQEKATLRAQLDAEAAESAAAGGVRVRDSLANPRVWGSAVVWFCLMAGAYGLLFWLPTVIKQMSTTSDVAAAVLTAVPWIGIGSGMMLNAWHSDRTQERFWHFGIPAALAAVFLAAAATVPPGPAALVCILIGASFMGSAQGVYWAIPTSFLSGAAMAAGLTVINMIGNSAGIVTPPLIGWIQQESGSFRTPIYAMAGLMLLAALMMIPLGRSLRNLLR